MGVWTTLATVLVGAAFLCVDAQLPVPDKPPGFVYGEGSAAAGVQLESYVDLMCPASAAAFPGLQKLATHYKPDEFRLKFVLFPLPYHQHAFTAAEATFTITAALGETAFSQWLEVMYDQQENFWNKPTQHLSTGQVTEQFYKLAKQTFPTLSRADWDKSMTGFGGTDADAHARAAWKYTCSRGVSGTPMYTLNGVPFDADAGWTFEDWKNVVDPLVQHNHAEEDDDAVER